MLGTGRRMDGARVVGTVRLLDVRARPFDEDSDIGDAIGVWLRESTSEVAPPVPHMVHTELAVHATEGRCGSSVTLCYWCLPHRASSAASSSCRYAPVGSGCEAPAVPDASAEVGRSTATRGSCLSTPFASPVTHGEGRCGDGGSTPVKQGEASSAVLRTLVQRRADGLQRGRRDECFLRQPVSHSSHR